MGENTIPQLFVIESLTREEERRPTEGQLLRDILAHGVRSVNYVYIRTEEEFPWALSEFRESGDRYLHISCHGDQHAVQLSLDTLEYKTFCEYLKPVIESRRVFLSACEAVNERVAELLLPNSECYSLLGPSFKIDSRDAVLMWSVFYHLIFRDLDDQDEKVKRGKINWARRRIKAAFAKEFDCYVPTHSGRGFRSVDIEERPTPGTPDFDIAQL